MARYKPATGKLENLDDVDLALKEIGVMERELEVIDAKANEKILAIKNDAKKKGEVHRKNIAELSAKIGSYADYNREELFKDRKSIELTFGVFGFRKSTSISVRKTTVELLKKCGLTDFLNIKETPNKDKMSALDDETLAQVDAVRKIKDDFFCQPNKEEVNKELLKSAL